MYKGHFFAAPRLNAVARLDCIRQTLSHEPSALPQNLESFLIASLIFIFTGQVSDLNIWNRNLNLSEMNNFSNCKKRNTFLQNSPPKAVQWSSLRRDFVGKSVTNRTFSSLDICLDNSSNPVKILPSLVLYKEGRDICHQVTKQIITLL